MVQKRQGAFTLVELLAAVTIALVLASMLLPALALAKARARSIKCQSNERQLTLAWTMYSDDTGKLAGNGYTRGGGEATKPMWAQGYYNHHITVSDSTNAALLLDARFAQFSAYIGDVRIYKCPSDRKVFADRKQGITFEKLRSYAMNCYLGWLDDGPWRPKGQICYRESAFLSPADKFVFLDLHPESICWPFFGVETNDVFFMVPAVHHNGAATLSFADGHVAAKRWSDPRTLRYPEDVVWHDHHYLSPGNPDLQWLRKQASQ